MASFVDLYRASYLKPGTDGRLNYLSAKYLNIRLMVSPSREYVVKAADEANSFGIAYNVYGDPGYWWIVCFYNGILNPITDIVPGTRLQLPSLADVNAFLTGQSAAEAATVTI
jgi:hypothetical protein